MRLVNIPNHQELILIRQFDHHGGNVMDAKLE